MSEEDDAVVIGAQVHELAGIVDSSRASATLVKAMSRLMDLEYRSRQLGTQPGA